uniref:Chloroplast-localized small heat shock protein 22 n=1 Tax=Funaria hygrometrica TaxID=29583 RepID=Q9SE11_FUNHY|nr:chloroplast-localized small heat shock protein 22 [Funaria hygrometrica]
MAARTLSRVVASPARSFLSTFRDTFLMQGRSPLPRQAPFSVAQRMAVSGSAQTVSDDDYESRSQLEKMQNESNASQKRSQGGLRRVVPRDLAASFFDVWDPFLGNKSLRQMLNTVDRLFDDPFFSAAPSRPTGIALDFRTPWDVKEDNESFRLRFDMPGLGKDEVKVYVEDGDLVIKGAHRAEEQKENNWSSRSYGSYNTRMTLPENVKIDEVKAELKNGVLQVVVPKSKEEPKKNVIDINVE